MLSLQECYLDPIFCVTTWAWINNISTICSVDPDGERLRAQGELEHRLSCLWRMCLCSGEGGDHQVDKGVFCFGVVKLICSDMESGTELASRVECARKSWR